MKSWIFIIVLLSTALAGIVVYETYQFEVKALSPEGGEIIVDVPPGTSFSHLPAIFASHKLEINPRHMKVWLKIFSRGAKLRVGEYQIQKSWSASEALRQIVSGQPLRHKFIVKEGWNIYDIRLELERIRGPQGGEEFMKLVRDPKLLARIPLPETLPDEYRSLEGFLFPETYSYSKYESTRSLVSAMIDEFERRALPLLKDHPWMVNEDGLFKLITLASIVEKESGNQEEQPLVASVFWNRLNKKMRLQSDPTTIYALFPNFDGNLRKADLLRSTPYNTYTISGLPIGPISNPGSTALAAIMKPASTNYFYFVARGDGSHEFAPDYPTHEKNVRKFQLKR